MSSLFNSTSKVKAISTICLIFGTLFCLKTATIFLLASEVNYSYDISTSPIVVTNISTTSTTEDNDRGTASLDEVGDFISTNASNTTVVDEGNLFIDTNVSDITTHYEDSYFIVFVIPSHPNKMAVRHAIRDTWANITSWSLLANQDEYKKKIRVMFVIGTLSSGSYSAEFQDEVSQNNDMFVVSNITEGYYSLRYKVLWGMAHSYQHFKFRYLVKTDDDITVNLPVLIQVLSGFAPGLRYAGRCANIVGSKPQRWRYCSGGGYVLSRDLVGQMLNLPDSVHNHSMKPEDVFTGWLVWNVNNLNNVHNSTQYTVRPRFYFQALSMGRYKCGPLNKWFYHGYKGKNYQYRVKAFRDVFMNNSIINCGT